MSEYTSQEALKKTLTLSGTTFADYDIIPAIAAASDAMNELCGRKFDLDTSEDTVRLYRPASGTVVVVNDIIELTSCFCDMDGDGDFEEEFVLDKDFFLWPYNALADDRPHTQLHLNTMNAKQSFPAWNPRSVEVTGKFGWPVLPSFLEVTTKMLAARLIKRMREAPFGVVTVGLDIGSAIRIGRTDPDILALTEEYTREKVV